MYTNPDDPARPDDGLFGRGSVTWRLMNNRIMWVAPVRALLLQALHPRTRVDEPELLLWVHCGEVASIADVGRRSDLAASAADLDAFVDEQRRRAVLVGLDSGIVPASMAELDIYFKQMRPGLRACDEAKESLRLLFHPPVPDGNRALKLGLPPFNALAFATLPGWVRRMYGRQGGPLTDIAATAGLRAARLALGRQRLFLGAAARAQPSAPRGLIHRRFRYEARRLGLRVVAPFRAKTTISITAR